jgi:hypothetical protein
MITIDGATPSTAIATATGSGGAVSTVTLAVNSTSSASSSSLPIASIVSAALRAAGGAVPLCAVLLIYRCSRSSRRNKRAELGPASTPTPRPAVAVAGGKSTSSPLQQVALGVLPDASRASAPSPTIPRSMPVQANVRVYPAVTELLGGGQQQQMSDIGGARSECHAGTRAAARGGVSGVRAGEPEMSGKRSFAGWRITGVYMRYVDGDGVTRRT